MIINYCDVLVSKLCKINSNKGSIEKDMMIEELYRYHLGIGY
jgi:hypothetical protein